jgi:hypothetical protein
MISNQTELYSFVSGGLIRHGFVRKNEGWYKEFDEVICFFFLKKFNPGIYEELVGIFYKGFLSENDHFPVYYKSDLKFSLSSIGMSQEELKIFDLNMNFRNRDRENVIEKCLVEYVIPTIDLMGSIEGFKVLLEKYPDLSYRVNLRFKNVLRINENLK